MLLFGNATNPELEGNEAKQELLKGRTALEQTQEIVKTIGAYIVPNLKSAYDNLTKNMLGMEDSAMALNRTMGGFIDKSGELQRKLENAYLKNLEFGAVFKDAAETAQGMASQMGRMVNPSEKVLYNALAFSKAASMTNAETGKMIIQFQQYGGNQEDAVNTMSELGKSARKSGLDAKSFTTEVAKNLKQASLFGFKNGIKDIEQIVKKTKLLGTSLESLQIKGAAEKLLDPEEALKTASSLQMIGGNVGALADPFQLLYMGQKDMKKLTDEVLNMSKATFSFNKETGAFEQSTEDMYQLRAQAQALGISYEEAANAGKELAKVEYIKSVANLESLTEDQQNLIGGLSQIDKNGKVTVDLPGFEEGNRNLAELMEDQNFKDALNAYEKNAEKSDKELAIEQMSIAEKQLATENEIKNLLLSKLSDAERKKFLDEQSRINEKLNTTAVGMSQTPAQTVATSLGSMNTIVEAGVDKALEETQKLIKEFKIDEAMKSFEENYKDIATSVTTWAKEGIEKINIGTTEINTKEQGGDPMADNTNTNTNTKPKEQGGNPMDDGLFANLGKTPLISAAGQLFKPRMDDQIAVGTELVKTLMEGEKATEFLSKLTKGNFNNSNQGKQEVSGKVEFGDLKIKIDAPGVDTSQLQKMIDSKQFKDQLMIMVTNQKSYFSNQGTLEG
jgi:hypothetical protein